MHTEATGSCDTQPSKQNPNGYPIYPRQTKLFVPRVDERLCSREGAPTEIAIIGVDDDGKKSWEGFAGISIWQASARSAPHRRVGRRAGAEIS